jgi:hypothetical protein
MGFLGLIKAAWSNPLVRQILIYVLIAIGCLAALRLYGNRQWMKGELKGEKTSYKSIEKMKQAEWDKKEKGLAAQQASIDVARTSLEEARAQFSKDKESAAQQRRKDDALRSAALEEIRKGREADRVNASTIPASELNGAVRALSGKLASEPSPIK